MSLDDKINPRSSAPVPAEMNVSPEGLGDESKGWEQLSNVADEGYGKLASHATQDGGDVPPVATQGGTRDAIQGDRVDQIVRIVLVFTLLAVLTCGAHIGVPMDARAMLAVATGPAISYFFARKK